MNNKEIWKDIPGYEGLYQASNFGRIKSLDRITKRKSKLGLEYIAMYKSKIMHGTAIRRTNGPSYLMVFLTNNKGVGNKEYIHQLVANAFIPKNENKPCINHINFDTHNNSVSNLERCTQRENILHTFMYDANSKIRMKEFNIIDASTNIIIETSWCVNEIARKLNINHMSIRNRLNGIIKGEYKGYYFSYK